ncbi:kinase-like domain-containing protein [Choanephora cucurbitarum]|nr:kinase-like domain-containing protein [Choanephora cucurbitarum]
MDDRTHSKSRDKSTDRSQERKSTSEKRSREEHYGRSRSRDRYRSSSSHREKRRNYDRYDRRHRDKSRDRWSSTRRSSKERDSRNRKDRTASYHRRDSTKQDDLPLGPKADTVRSKQEQPPTAPAAYYQPPNSPLVQRHQHYFNQNAYSQDPQQTTAAAIAWAHYYGWTVQDYNNAYGTQFTPEQYQHYAQQYYQSQGPSSYYGYYDANAYYQQQQIPQSTIPSYPSSTKDPSQPSLPPTITSIPTTHNQPPIEPIKPGVPIDVLDQVGYPFQTSDNPTLLFEKIGQVGEGTYGKVYKARNGKTGKLMALKRIRMKNERDGFPITAMREIKLLQKLKHERIVELQQIMVAKGSVYMVLEYMDHDLSGILGHPNFNFEPAHAKSLVKQMLEGLAYLHHMGILHRDIKGSNLLINNKGELKIADFGLARVFEKKKAHDYSNRVITLWYRPPELLLGTTAYGPAVDIWSVGCIMLEFFTGKAVFNGTDEVSQLECIYKIMGTPSVDNWPTLKELPWFELVKPQGIYPSRFRELYGPLLSPGALELSEALLSMDPINRPTAAEALEFEYFKKESPEPVMPANLLDIHGDWHEFESKQRKRQKATNPQTKKREKH